MTSTPRTWSAEDRARIMDRRYRKARQLRLMRGESTSLVSADSASEYARRLFDLGWSGHALAQLAPLISDTTWHNLAAREFPTIERKTRGAALAVPLSLYVPASVLDTSLVPSLGATRRVQALMRIGWTHGDLRARGIESQHFARRTYHQCLASKWRAADALYRELCMTPGPSKRTASRAERAGYVAPLAWENIDDPNEKPVGIKVCSRPNCAGEVVAHGICKVHYTEGRTISRTRLDEAIVDRILAGDWRLSCSPAEKAEVCRRWVADGGVLTELERLTGWATHRYFRKGADFDRAREAS